MKVIFLDIDGVMNSELHATRQHRRRWLRLSTYRWWIISKVKFVLNGFKHKSFFLADIKQKTYTFDYLFKRLKESTDPRCWKLLRNLVAETSCKICVSSVWKHHFKNNKDWNKAFMRLGFSDGVFVGVTGDRRTLRGSEIKEWMDTNQPIERYAIIDDDSDMLKGQLKNFFQTDGYCGLSPNISYRVKRHLNDETR